MFAFADTGKVSGVIGLANRGVIDGSCGGEEGGTERASEVVRCGPGGKGEFGFGGCVKGTGYSIGWGFTMFTTREIMA